MNPECVAIGECGLDYSKDFSSPDVQRNVFEKQVRAIFNYILFVMYFTYMILVQLCLASTGL